MLKFYEMKSKYVGKLSQQINSQIICISIAIDNIYCWCQIQIYGRQSTEIQVIYWQMMYWN